MVDDSGDSTGPTSNDRRETDLLSVKFVGPVTANVLLGSGISMDDLRERQISYVMLLELGINPGVAARIRREHSLPWSFDHRDDQLKKRARLVRGLSEHERTWIAESENRNGSPMASASPDGGRTRLESESTWRARSFSFVVEEIPEIPSSEAVRLADAGYSTVRSLADADETTVATIAGTNMRTAKRWKRLAHDRL